MSENCRWLLEFIRTLISCAGKSVDRCLGRCPDLLDTTWLWLLTCQIMEVKSFLFIYLIVYGLSQAIFGNLHVLVIFYLTSLTFYFSLYFWQQHIFLYFRSWTISVGNIEHTQFDFQSKNRTNRRNGIYEFTCCQCRKNFCEVDKEDGQWCCRP